MLPQGSKHAIKGKNTQLFNLKLAHTLTNQNRVKFTKTILNGKYFINYKCCRNNSCFPFFTDSLLENSRKNYMRFHTNLKLGSVVSATLVVRRNPQVLTKKLLRRHRLLIATIFGVPNRLSHSVGHPKIIETNRNWIKLDITSILKSKGSNNMMKNISIELKCEECGSEKAFVNSKKRRPFLIFNVKAVTKLRKRRSPTCPSQDLCCLETLIVNLASMGFPFIIQPKNFQMNYCKGPCKSRGSTGLFLRRFNLFGTKTVTYPNDNCCVVKKMDQLSILYKDDDDTIIRRIVKDVTATQCECA